MADDGELQYWKDEAVRLADELRRLQRAHAILEHREWFAIKAEQPGRNIADEEGRYSLYFCDRQGTFPCCTLGPKDVVLVGRYTGEPEREAAVEALAGVEDPDKTPVTFFSSGSLRATKPA